MNALNIFNRIAVVLLLLVVIFISAVIMVDTFINVIDSSTVLDAISPTLDFLGRFGLAGILFLVLLISILLLILELYIRRPQTVTVANLETGKARISVTSIADQIRQDVIRVSEIHNARVRVEPKGKGIVARLLVEISQDIDVPGKTQEVMQVVQNTVSSKLGLKLIDTKMTLVYVPPSPARPGGIFVSETSGTRQVMESEEGRKEAEEQPPATPSG
ncbi:hypothetical protein HKBW3S06_00591 [Candidatus Hakubella thermalkaliphila]|uniref:Alkaline shock response membrane anchor protein AmaP n=1 Tax=Candidatus Hakubella thermalkaliphila TaxID=2754717 RepID=A0A6V8NM84_9ACTN|nr:alkaline shock response membrane anchor protein AmaP [Candidatus Hakubella thermalkaliphila]GFP21365.1 hypothetical protein HKBW3S06_00591 [Candidatus Hakubella thermalkaliphila]